MSAVNTVVDKLNNKYLLALIAGLFVYGIVRRVTNR